ncbi:MAG: vWA domain-containing protein [Planctomycetota bacterium]
MLSELHFLRPWWLAAIPLAILVTALVHEVHDAKRSWRGIISDHLLDALLVRAEHRRRLVPVHLLGLASIVTPLALAGPTWEREPSPFATESAAMVLVVEATTSMRTEDIRPSRLERASQKIADLLELRPDTHAALVAYAGSAHVAMPITRDTSIVATFAAALDPAVMPAEGDALAGAVALANEQLEVAGRAGSVVLFSDGAPDGEVTSVAATASVPVHVLAVTAGAVPGSLEAIARATGGSVTAVTPDRGDVERLAARARRDIGRAVGDESAGRWRDMGYWLVPVVALLALAWSRRGWSVRYAGLGAAGGEP